jgi:hypothetical protein
VLLYGDTPVSGEPTLELVRRSLPADGTAPAAAAEILLATLARWGWEPVTDAANGCVSAVLHAVTECAPERIELFAFRRLHQLTVELHFSGDDSMRFRQLLGHDSRLAMVDSLASLWGVRPLGDGEAVWFEFRGDSA